jgi:hypothetical protein
VHRVSVGRCSLLTFVPMTALSYGSVAMKWLGGDSSVAVAGSLVLYKVAGLV